MHVTDRGVVVARTWWRSLSSCAFQAVFVASTPQIPHRTGDVGFAVVGNFPSGCTEIDVDPSSGATRATRLKDGDAANV